MFPFTMYIFLQFWYNIHTFNVLALSLSFLTLNFKRVHRIYQKRKTNKQSLYDRAENTLTASCSDRSARPLYECTFKSFCTWSPLFVFVSVFLPEGFATASQEQQVSVFRPLPHPTPSVFVLFSGETLGLSSVKTNKHTEKRCGAWFACFALKALRIPEWCLWHGV